MIPFAVRIIAIPAVALVVATIGAVLYFKSVEKPASVATAPPPAQEAVEPSPSQSPQSTTGPPHSAPAQPGASGAAPAKPPEFDIVRVEPSGETVVAGRAPGAARVELLDQGKVVADERVDANGQFVLLPPALAGGDHLLTLRITPEGQGPASSTQSVAVAVRPGTSPIVTLAEPGKPSMVLAAPSPSAAPPPSAVPSSPAAAQQAPTRQQPTEIAGVAPPSSQVTIRTAEIEAGGRFFATGVAPAGSTVRLYLNGSHVADAAAAADGQWSLTINKGLSGGKYALRADAIGAEGKVISRAEVPFEAPAALVAAAPTAPVSRPNAPPRVGPPPAEQTTASTSPPSQSAAEPAPPSSTSSTAAKDSPTPASSPRAAPAQTATPVATSNPAANPVIPEIATATVTRGDSLWRISRRHFGQGTRYTVIYEANSSQIRNPNLIYTGQVLVMPHK